MSQSIYSYNGSPVKFKMEDIVADAYNRAMNAWFEAQRNLKKTLGRDLIATDLKSIEISMTQIEHAAWNAVSDKINQLISEGLVLKGEDCTSDYLVKL